MFIKRYISVVLFVACSHFSQGQKTEIGIWLGSANYFGDLNTTTSFEFLGPGGGVFLRNNLGTRVAFKHSVNFGIVAFRDDATKVPFQLQRNLSFKSNILELSSQFEFNFFTYNPVKDHQRFTPYLQTGFSVFFFNPKAEYQGQWVELQPLGTEGQNDADYTGRDKYKLVSYAFHIGGGIKYAFTRKWAIGIDVAVRKTLTDYLDDVSTTYVEPISLPGGDDGLSAALSDRSGEVGNPIGVPGYARGTSLKKDDFLMAGITISYTFINDKCPWPPSAR